MVNLYIIGCGILVIFVGLVFFGFSFSFVDTNHSFTWVGFGLFLGGIVVMIIGGIATYIGSTTD